MYKVICICNIYIYINFVCHIQMSNNTYKKPRHLFTKKLYIKYITFSSQQKGYLKNTKKMKENKKYHEEKKLVQRIFDYL